MIPRRVLLLALLAVLYAGLNFFKPLHIDDAAYVYYARQFVRRPLDPYGFWLIWYQAPEPAHEILAPPLLPASWAPAVALFGERPWLWKVFLLPWSFLLVGALDALLRRFARGLEAPLLVLLVLSPALLPSLNLMLDVPALALALAAVALFLRACDRHSFAGAALAGLLAGLAMQTKYTAFLAPAVMLAAAMVYRRWRLWPVAAVVAMQVFVTWEFLMALLYQQSHFLFHYRTSGFSLMAKLALLRALFGNAGALLPASILLGMAALGLRRRWLLLCGLAAVLGYAVVFAFGAIGPPHREFELLEGVCDLFCLVGLVVGGLAALEVFLGDIPQTKTLASDTFFLTLWLLLEVLGYLAMSPFPAVRRMLGLVVVVTLLFGVLAARTCVAPQRRRIVWAIAAGNALLGLAFWAVDCHEARSQQEAVELAHAWITDHQEAGDGGQTWYVGHWGFQFAAEHAGMRPVYPDYTAGKGYIELPPPSRLRRGDWLVVPGWRVHRQDVDLRRAPVRKEIAWSLRDPIPLPVRTSWCYYLGFTPVEHHDGPRMDVTVYRVLADFTPQAAPSQ